MYVARSRTSRRSLWRCRARAKATTPATLVTGRRPHVRRAITIAQRKDLEQLAAPDKITFELLLSAPQFDRRTLPNSPVAFTSIPQNSKLTTRLRLITDHKGHGQACADQRLLQGIAAMPTTQSEMFGNVKEGTAAMSLTEIGKLYGVSLQAIQHVEKRAMNKIRAAIEAEANRAGCTPREWLTGEG